MPDDDGDLTADELDDAYDLATDNVIAWLEHPCEMHHHQEPDVDG